MKHSPVIPVAVVLLIGLSFVYAYRRAFQGLEQWWKTKLRAPTLRDCLLKPVPTWTEVFLVLANYYTILYGMCAWLIYLELNSAFTLLRATDYLDPKELREQFSTESNLPSWWEDELKHMFDEYGCGLLRYWSLLTPVCLIFTFIVSCYNTGKHVRQILNRGGGVGGNPGVDSTILIVGLPLITCLMAFRSVTRMWMICANSKAGSLSYATDFEGNHSWVARLVVLQKYLEANLATADMYESWALMHFARLILQVIGTKYDSHDFSQKSRHAIEMLTFQGLYLFNGICIFEAIFYTATSLIEAFNCTEFTWMLDREIYNSRTQVHFFLLGVGAIASTAAIGNVVAVEHTFADLLVDFHPLAKFWSTKVLVSIAFLQSIVLYLPPLNALSVTEQDLLYSSALCVECAFLSLWHLHAWKPGEPWYDGLSKALQESE